MLEQMIDSVTTSRLLFFSNFSHLTSSKVPSQMPPWWIKHDEVPSWLPFQWTKCDKVPSLRYKSFKTVRTLVTPPPPINTDFLLQKKRNLYLCAQQSQRLVNVFNMKSLISCTFLNAGWRLLQQYKSRSSPSPQRAIMFGQHNRHIPMNYGKRCKQKKSFNRMFISVNEMSPPLSGSLMIHMLMSNMELFICSICPLSLSRSLSFALSFSLFPSLLSKIVL